MGNLSYIVPMEKQELATDVQALVLFLKEKLPEFSYGTNTEFNLITVEHKQAVVCIIFLDIQESCLYEETIIDDFKYLEENYPHLVKSYSDFINVGGITLPRMGITYENVYPFELRELVCRTIFLETKAFWFDDGIHSEFIPPDYQFKKPIESLAKKLKQKHFWDAFKRLITKK